MTALHLFFIGGPEAAGRERQLSGRPVRVPERRHTAARATSSCIEKSCSGSRLEFLEGGIRAKAQVAQPRFELAVGTARATPSRSGERRRVGPSAIAAPRIAVRVRRALCRPGGGSTPPRGTGRHRLLQYLPSERKKNGDADVMDCGRSTRY
jgi:hypothetical protein